LINPSAKERGKLVGLEVKSTIQIGKGGESHNGQHDSNRDDQAARWFCFSRPESCDFQTMATAEVQAGSFFFDFCTGLRTLQKFVSSRG
jgi:hypothetical protein